MKASDHRIAVHFAHINVAILSLHVLYQQHPNVTAGLLAVVRRVIVQHADSLIISHAIQAGS